MELDEKVGCDALFNCTRCGECCKGYGGTYLTPDDIDAISRFLGINAEELLTRFTQQSGNRPVIAQKKDGYCVFWDKLCSIHSVKPEMCRRWPFIRSILVDVGNWRAMAASCPGMDIDAPDRQILECIKNALED
jgi:Fe-S-cluster containining protein